MAMYEGLVTVFEVSDGGETAKPFWQFFVSEAEGSQQVVHTTNRELAKAMQLAVLTNNPVRVDFDENINNRLRQVRLAFKYASTAARITPDRLPATV